MTFTGAIYAVAGLGAAFLAYNAFALSSGGHVPVAAPPVVSSSPGVPGPPASSPSAGAVGVHGSPQPRIVLVGVTPPLGLPSSAAPPSSGPTVLPTPSASGSSATLTQSPPVSPSPSTTTGHSLVALTVVAALTPTPTLGVGIGVGLLTLEVGG